MHGKTYDAISKFYDLYKAFECMHHDTLRSEKFVIMVWEAVTSTFTLAVKSYLRDSVQRTDVNGTNHYINVISSIIMETIHETHGGPTST